MQKHWKDSAPVGIDQIEHSGHVGVELLGRHGMMGLSCHLCLTLSVSNIGPALLLTI